MHTYYDIDYRGSLRRMLQELEELKTSEAKASKSLTKTRNRINQLEKITVPLEEMVGSLEDPPKVREIGATE